MALCSSKFIVQNVTKVILMKSFTLVTVELYIINLHMYYSLMESVSD